MCVCVCDDGGSKGCGIDSGGGDGSDSSGDGGGDGGGGERVAAATIAARVQPWRQVRMVVCVAWERNWDLSFTPLIRF